MPNGAAVTLNAEHLLSDIEIKNPKYVEFVQQNVGRVFHIFRPIQPHEEDFDTCIVALLEDKTEPRWLFWTGDLIAVEGDTNV